MTQYFDTRYFFIRNISNEKYIKWNTVQGILADGVNDDYEIISDLMAQDIRDAYGDDYDVWEITEEEFEKRVRPPHC